MKKISELGLETIQLEDQVLLVDQNLNMGGDTKYYLNGFIGRLYSNPQYQSYDILDFDGSLLERVRIKPEEKPYRIIASTKPLEGLPLLVIEDEASETFNEIPYETREFLHSVSFKRGYNKAKEMFRFTEEDMGDLIEICIDLQGEGRLIKQIDAIQRFNKTHKKELWVEVEYKDLTGRWYSWPTILAKTDRPTRLKITNNTIKAVWK